MNVVKFLLQGYRDIMNSSYVVIILQFQQGQGPSAIMQRGLCPLCPPGSYSPDDVAYEIGAGGSLYRMP